MTTDDRVQTRRESSAFLREQFGTFYRIVIEDEISTALGWDRRSPDELAVTTESTVAVHGSADHAGVGLPDGESAEATYRVVTRHGSLQQVDDLGTPVTVIVDDQRAQGSLSSEDDHWLVCCEYTDDVIAVSLPKLVVADPPTAVRLVSTGGLHVPAGFPPEEV